MAALKNYYKILGVPQHAGREEIKAAYRSLAKIHHPDRNFSSRESEERFKEIQEAYQVLMHDERRRKYDLKLKYGLSYAYTKTAAGYPRQRKRDPSAAGRKPPPPPKPKNFFDKHKILLSFITAVILLLIIRFCSKEQYTPKPRISQPGTYTPAP